ncbi:SURNod19 domain-containing protein [Cephalotus follicularis]|uniref:SURNod19 domain-containing protein n=1 Tax=Cephalotus follicularis TaxID=3775 RepID=A0A1Q3CRP4_CEPFO|nr:SURNod19 domain-containing protein [Cephalotus follicularis]
MLNVHAIDTRGVEDRWGCTECRCNLYNVTVDEFGGPLPPGYRGGLDCCYDHTQCKLRQGFKGAKRSLYLRYTVKWVDWDIHILPLKIYILDFTDNWKRISNSTGLDVEHDCRIEYDVEPCSVNGDVDGKCVDSKKLSLIMPNGGYVIYGVAHQHAGGIISTLYREDGQVICSSNALYGDGEEVGNEAGYVVGMSTCYPKPGSIKIANGETLILEANYSSTQFHTGVMSLFYLLVADQAEAL